MNENTISKKLAAPRKPVLAWLHLDHIEVVELVLNDRSATDRERELALRLLSVLEAVEWVIPRGLTDYAPR